MFSYFHFRENKFPKTKIILHPSRKNKDPRNMPTFFREIKCPRKLVPIRKFAICRAREKVHMGTDGLDVPEKTILP